MSFGAISVDYLFQRKDVVEIRNFLREHNVDVNECSIPLDSSNEIYYSVLTHALRNFDHAVMTCLLEEFGADLNLPCMVCLDDPRKPGWRFPAFCALITHRDTVDAVEYVLEHGATPFVTASENTAYLKERVDGGALLLLEYAKRRCRTAWTTVWVLSQLTGTLWPDMSEALAKMIVGIPLREFSKDSVKRHKK